MRSWEKPKLSGRPCTGNWTLVSETNRDPETLWPLLVSCAQLRVFAWAIPSTCNALVRCSPDCFLLPHVIFQLIAPALSNKSTLMVPCENRISPLCHSHYPAPLVSSQPYFHLTWCIYLLLVISFLSINLVHSVEPLLFWQL